MAAKIGGKWHLQSVLLYSASHCDLKVESSRAKIVENFANYFLKTIAKDKCFIVLKCACLGLQKAYLNYSGKMKAQRVATLQR